MKLAATSLSADRGANYSRGYSYTLDVRTSPRPLRIHILQYDLRDLQNKICVSIGVDPDGGGSIEATLTDPIVLAAQENIVAGINANPWAYLDPPTNLYADIRGIAVSNGTYRSFASTGAPAFYITSENKGQIIETVTNPVTQNGVAGFSMILKNFVNTQSAGTLNPRSLIGYDETNNKITMVVVDGRQTGFSEGMSTQECADLMKQLGCKDALSLDGGGSSVMVIQGTIVNSPSDGTPRPIPVLIGVKSSN